MSFAKGATAMLQSLAAKLTAGAAAFLLTAGGGALVYHNLPFIGPAARIASVKDKLAAKTADYERVKGERDTAREAVKGRDALLTANGNRAASEATELASVYKGACRDAFQAGLAAKRCPVPGAVPAPSDGLPSDLRRLQEQGAFRAATPAPGGVPRKR